MRYQFKDRLGVMAFTEVYPQTGVIRNQQLLNCNAATGVVEKSDIVRTVKDTTGWRQPTDYFVSDSVIERQYGSRQLHFVITDPAVINGNLDVTWEGPCDWTPAIQPTDASGYRREVIPEDLYGLMINKNLIKLRDQKVNLALNLAELNKTASGIAQSAIKLKTSLSAFRRGDFKKSLSTLGLTTRRKGKDSASTWLELQYGILPLMGDIHGGYQEMTRKTRQHGMRKRVKSTWGRDFAFTENNIPVEQFDYRDSGIFTGNVDFKLSLRAQLVLWYEVDNPMLLAASSVGLTNPAEIVWELTPWSFVVDWFLPIGDYLAALTASQGFKFLGGSYTTTTEDVNRRWISAGAPRPWVLDNRYTVSAACSGERVTRQKVVRRQAIGTYSPPRAFLPSFESPLSVQHALNALALLRSIK